MTVTKIRVGRGELGESGVYDVVLGHQVSEELPGLLRPDTSRALIVHQRALKDAAQGLVEVLQGAGIQAFTTEIPDAEQGKTVATLASCWHELGQANFTRNDAVIGLGGGAATDLAGFVAASWLRGVQVVQVPTTLLGMVDAAVGGKTGINTEEGKNLVGAFHPPVGVLADLANLQTLPQPDLIAGLGEIIKCGFIAQPRILELLEADAAACATWDSPQLREMIEHSIQVKADVVTDDLKESGLREILNYGHTFGHAVEQVENFSMRHGEAVAIGMMYIAELGHRAGVTPASVIERQRAILSSVGLPTSYRPDKWSALLAAMRRDKKARGNLLRFVVLSDVAAVTRLEGPSDADLIGAYEAISAG